jgi:hypothetical protein
VKTQVQSVMVGGGQWVYKQTNHEVKIAHRARGIAGGSCAAYRWFGGFPL